MITTAYNRPPNEIPLHHFQRKARIGVNFPHESPNFDPNSYDLLAVLHPQLLHKANPKAREYY
jgi:hypothetical protein